jgi:hypothetical protein
MSKKMLCRLCGKSKKMTEEHVPPQSAFNNKPIKYQTFTDIMGLSLHPYPKKSSNGLKQFCLCRECNSKTGGDYGSAFVEWTKQADAWLAKLDEWRDIPLRYEIQPLNVLKQILVMGLAWLPIERLHRYKSWREYLQNRDDKRLPKDLRVYAYFNKNTSPRIIDMNGAVMRVDLSSLEYVHFELALAPLGYCITSAPKDSSKSLAKQLGIQDITEFSQFDWNQKQEVYLELPLREAHVPLPLDYRTKAEVDEHNQKYGIKDS